MRTGGRVLTLGLICSIISGCDKQSADTVDPDTQVEGAPAADAGPTSATVESFRECLRARAEGADFDDEATRDELIQSLPALRGAEVDDVADGFESRFSDRDDRCVVTDLIDRCVAFAKEETADEGALENSFQRCEEEMAATDGASDGGGQALAEDREPVLEMFEHANFNAGKEMARVIRLPRSCPNLGKPASCGATGRMQSFERVMTSFRLEDGYTAVFYSDTMFRGDELKIPDDSPHETKDLNKKFDDTAASVKIFDPDGKEL